MYQIITNRSIEQFGSEFQGNERDISNKEFLGNDYSQGPSLSSTGQKVTVLVGFAASHLIWKSKTV